MTRRSPPTRSSPRRDAALLPDGQPRALGVLFPAVWLRDDVAVEVCEAGTEPRCVRLDVR
ncbi:MAG: hypothetical protein R3F43_03955 [bacterium]